MYAMYFSKDEIGGRYPSLCNIFNNVYLHMYSISIKLIAFYVYMFIKKIKISQMSFIILIKLDKPKVFRFLFTTIIFTHRNFAGG